MGNKMVFWFVVRVIGITTLLIGLYVLYTGISPFSRSSGISNGLTSPRW